jgi:hypothetical protein
MKSRSIFIEGQLQGKFNYKDGETHGTQERFDGDGSLLSSFELKVERWYSISLNQIETPNCGRGRQFECSNGSGLTTTTDPLLR